jgi:hypothetical protein
VSHLNEFRDHLNARFGTADAPIIPAGPSGAPWRLTTRQFRRTIAWHIANRPFGAIAGIIQYKHASVAAFEGYAGSSRSGFRAEIETERRLGQIEDILTISMIARPAEDFPVLPPPGSAKLSMAPPPSFSHFPERSPIVDVSGSCWPTRPAPSTSASSPTASSTPLVRFASVVQPQARKLRR